MQADAIFEQVLAQSQQAPAPAAQKLGALLLRRRLAIVALIKKLLAAQQGTTEYSAQDPRPTAPTLETSGTRVRWSNLSQWMTGWHKISARVDGKREGLKAAHLAALQQHEGLIEGEGDVAVLGEAGRLLYFAKKAAPMATPIAGPAIALRVLVHNRMARLGSAPPRPYAPRTPAPLPPAPSTPCCDACAIAATAAKTMPSTPCCDACAVAGQTTSCALSAPALPSPAIPLPPQAVPPLPGDHFRRLLPHVVLEIEQAEQKFKHVSGSIGGNCRTERRRVGVSIHLGDLQQMRVALEALAERADRDDIPAALRTTRTKSQLQALFQTGAQNLSDEGRIAKVALEALVHEQWAKTERPKELLQTLRTLRSDALWEAIQEEPLLVDQNLDLGGEDTELSWFRRDLVSFFVKHREGTNWTRWRQVLSAYAKAWPFAPEPGAAAELGPVAASVAAPPLVPDRPKHPDGRLLSQEVAAPDRRADQMSFLAVDQSRVPRVRPSFLPGWTRTDRGGKCDARWIHPTGWRLEHCGHPTANYPWSLFDPDGRQHGTGGEHGEPSLGSSWTDLKRAAAYVDGQIASTI